MVPTPGLVDDPATRGVANQQRFSKFDEWATRAEPHVSAWTGSATASSGIGESRHEQRLQEPRRSGYRHPRLPGLGSHYPISTRRPGHGYIGRNGQGPGNALVTTPGGAHRFRYPTYGRMKSLVARTHSARQSHLPRVTRVRTAGIVLVLLAAAPGSLSGVQDGDARPPTNLAHLRGTDPTETRVVSFSDPTRRARLCVDRFRAQLGPPPVSIVERESDWGVSVTFLSGERAYGCDGIVRRSGGPDAPWCGGAVGTLHAGKLLDPRIDIDGCRTAGSARPLGFAWIEATKATAWLSVKGRRRPAELYRVVDGIPTRVAADGVVVARSELRLAITSFDEHGRRLGVKRLRLVPAG